MPDKIYIPLKDRPADERPRERLWRLGPDRMHTAELLAILIRIGTKGRSAIQVAEDLLSQFGDGLSGISLASASEIAKVKGMGKAKSATLAAAFELARRAAARPPGELKTHLETVDEVAAYFRAQYGTQTPEKFVVFFINRRHRLLGELEVSRGGTSSVVVNPQVIFKEALLQNAKAIILAHNHPAGDLRPSRHDLDLTSQLQEAGALFRIPVAEHVLVAPGGAVGFLHEGFWAKD